MFKEKRTVRDPRGLMVLEIVRDDDNLIIFEADDMDRQIRFPAAAIPMLVDVLEKCGDT